ncbi:MAG: class I SAM-dependent methyltransferase [Thermoplasmatales archaeon]|nr:MAG: class I SAM-dependent methyltransferase [Thermoplasmatales archaeon]
MKKISIRNAKFAKIGLQDMCDYINKHESTRSMCLVEIGCYVGDSTEIFSKNFEFVFAIDPWQNGYDDKDAASFQIDMSIVEKQFNMLCKESGNICKIKAKSEIAVEKFIDYTVDVVYIDGLHTYDGVKNDIKMWLPKVKQYGFICGHDYGSKHFPGVKQAVDEHFGKYDIKTFSDSSWLVKLDEL